MIECRWLTILRICEFKQHEFKQRDKQTTQFKQDNKRSYTTLRIQTRRSIIGEKGAGVRGRKIETKKKRENKVGLQ